MLAAMARSFGLSTLMCREQGPSKDPVAGPTVKTGPLLPVVKPYDIENLSTPNLQALAAFAGASALPVITRSKLLDVVNTQIEASTCKTWEVVNAEVCRALMETLDRGMAEFLRCLSNFDSAVSLCRMYLQIEPGAHWFHWQETSGYMAAYPVMFTSTMLCVISSLEQTAT